MEAEYMGLSDCVKEVIWLRSLLKSTGYELNEPTMIFEDNNACLELARDPKHRERAKHIDLRYHFIRDHIAKGEFKLSDVKLNFNWQMG
jgi:hypothetical protein